MTQLNPFTGSILQSPVVQQQQQSMRQQQVEHHQRLRRNAAASSSDDPDTPNVENPEEIAPIHEQERDHGKNRKPRDHRQTEDQVELTSVAEPADELVIATPATPDGSAAPQAAHATAPLPPQASDSSHPAAEASATNTPVQATADATAVAHHTPAPSMPTPAASRNAKDEHLPLDIKA